MSKLQMLAVSAARHIERYDLEGNLVCETCGIIVTKKKKVK